MKNIYIKNIRIINPKTDLDKVSDVFIEDGIISKISEHMDAETFLGSLGTGEILVINGEGLILAPGLVDVHVHFRDPGFTYKEDMHTGALAAAKGGYTSVVLMANTNPTVDNTETLKYVINKADEEAINIYTSACVTKGMQGKELNNLSELISFGAIGLTDDGKPILDEKIITEAMEKAAELDVPISLHEEDPKYITVNGINAGSEAAELLGITGSDRMAEITLVDRDVDIAVKTGAKLNIQHISTEEAVQIVRNGKKKSGKIHAEATPHHFTLNEDAVKTYGTLAKMNPPLRTEADRMAIIEGLRDGAIDIIATDHAPHSKEEKEKDFKDAPSGITGLETALALGITELVDKEYISMRRLIELMSLNPSMLYGIDGGNIEENQPADIVIFDPNEEWIVDNYVSKADNSPFTGWKLKGKVKYTICRGKVVYEDRDNEQN